MLETTEKNRNRNSSYSIDDQPLIKRIHWFRLVFLTSLPLMALYGAFTTKVVRKTFYFNVFYLTLNSLSITAGHHRLWSHASYKATTALKIILAFSASASAQGSIYWWCRDHRIHHRYTDTPRDPYNATAGFFYCHMGWLLLKRDRRRLGYVDTSDLKADKVVMFQHNYYIPLATIFGFVIPIAVCGFGWGDWRGGYFYATLTRIALIHHTTFSVNSLAHTIGTSTYDDSNTAKDSFISAVVTLGEGYHNFHHEFPNDYRNGIRLYQYDPTRWFIELLSLVGLAYDLNTFPENEIEKGYVEMRLKELAKIQARLDYGVPLEKLPTFTQDEFEVQVNKSNKKWMVIQNVIYDVSTFINQHPGGKPLMNSGIGKDMTEAFSGGVYKHHKAAHNLLSQLRVGTIST